MSRRTRNSRKKEPSARSAACKKKMATIAEDMEGESIDSLLDDFDIQTTNLTKQSLKQFQKEARLLMSALPLKSSIPKEVLKMDLSEFIRRGGSFHLVWESLKNDKYEPEQVDKENSQVVTNTASVDEVSQGESGVDGQCMFVTPAMSTRSQRTRAKRGQTTAKRKPKPLEEVKVQAYSNVSGSPVDEKMLLQLHSDGLLGDIQDKIMEATASFPHKWRSKLVQSFRAIKAQAAVQDDVLVTPAIRR
jgi:hypothetical protein